MNGYTTALLLSLITVAAIIFLMRSRRIREKYAAAWIVLAIAVVVVGAFPNILSTMARAVGVQTPINLLFLLSGLLLLVLSVQFSIEISQLEEETRTLAEELALLRRDVEEGLGPRRTTAPEAEGAGPDGGTGTVAGPGAGVDPPTQP